MILEVHHVPTLRRLRSAFRPHAYQLLVRAMAGVGNIKKRLKTITFRGAEIPPARTVAETEPATPFNTLPVPAAFACKGVSFFELGRYILKGQPAIGQGQS